MADATVVYHHEEGTWWAESDDVPGLTVVADSFDEVRRLAREGLEFSGWVGGVHEVLEDGATVNFDPQAFGPHEWYRAWTGSGAALASVTATVSAPVVVTPNRAPVFAA